LLILAFFLFIFMMTEAQQIKEQINKSKNILVTTKKFLNGDNLSSGLAWYLLLKKLNKNVEIIIDNFSPPTELNFLPAIENIKKEASHLKKFIISLDISQTELEELSYDISNKELEIYLTAKKGFFRPADVKMKDSGYKFDLIIVLGSQELESLGALYDNHPDFFYQTTIINLDYQSQNDHFGQINLIELNKTAVAEITYYLFKSFNQALINEKIATCLLTGLISATNSFKSLRLTPECLNTASELISLGADKEKIITNLYRTKTINTLNLWGRVLSRLKAEENNKLIWSFINKEDLAGTAIKDNDFISIINELLSYTQKADLLLLFVENSNETKIYLYNNNLNLNLLPLIRQFNGVGDKNLIIFSQPQNLDNCLQEFLTMVKEFLVNNLNK